MALDIGFCSSQALGVLFAVGIYGLGIRLDGTLRRLHEVFNPSIEFDLLARDCVLPFCNGLEDFTGVVHEFEGLVHGDRPLAHRQHHGV